MMRRLGNLYLGLVVALLCAPLIVVIGVSLNERRVLLFPPRGVSLAWYETLFTESAWVEALVTSFAVAGLSAVLAVSIAMPVAWYLWRYELRYAKALFGLGLVPFALPPVIMAIGMLSFWAQLGWTGRIENLVIGHGILLVSLPLVMISLGLESIDREILEAARVMGADARRSFLTVVLPMLRPISSRGSLSPLSCR